MNTIWTLNTMYITADSVVGISVKQKLRVKDVQHNYMDHLHGSSSLD